MNSEQRRITLEEDTYFSVGLESNEYNASFFKKRMNEYVNILDEVVNTDFNKITDQEFYELLKKIYHIEIDRNDYLKMLSKYNNKEYYMLQEIPSMMVYKGIKTEGLHRSFDWAETTFQICYMAAVTKEFNLSKKEFSKEEIKEMVKNKDIVLLEKFSKEINGRTNFDEEDREDIPTLDINTKSYDWGITDFIQNNYYLLGELLRKKFTKKRILDDIRKMIKDINYDLNQIISSVNSLDKSYAGISRICKEWYDESDEKKIFESIEEKVKVKK